MNAEHRWTLRVSGLDHDRNVVFARRSQFEVGIPLSFDHDYERVTALEHFLAAIGCDVVSGLRFRAKRRRIEIENIEATVECYLENPLTFLEVVGEEGHPGVKEIRMIAYLSTLAEEIDLDQLWHDTLLRSPMIQTLKGAVKLDFEYKVVL